MILDTLSGGADLVVGRFAQIVAGNGVVRLQFQHPGKQASRLVGLPELGRLGGK